MRLRRYIQKNNIDLIHSNNWLVSLYITIACLGLNTIKVSTFHGYDHTWRNQIHFKILKKFQTIICTSKSLRIDLYRMGIPWSKLTPIYNCFDPERFTVQQPPSTIPQKTPFKIVMVSNFGWEKDQITLIKAIKLLKEREIEVQLDFVGNGDPLILNRCRKTAHSLNLNDSVIFHNSILVNADFLSRYDLFCFSSISETFGIALLEAMASGVPVLVSDIPSSMELIEYGKSGFYFTTHSAKECADKIALLISSPEMRTQIAQKGWMRAQRFHPEKIIRELENLYKEVVTKKEAPTKRV